MIDVDHWAQAAALHTCDLQSTPTVRNTYCPFAELCAACRITTHRNSKTRSSLAMHPAILLPDMMTFGKKTDENISARV